MSMMDGVAVEILAKTEIPQWKNSSVELELGKYIVLLLTGSNNQFRNPEFWIFTNFEPTY